MSQLWKMCIWPPFSYGRRNFQHGIPFDINISAPPKDEIDFRRVIPYVPKSQVYYVKPRNGDIAYCHVEISITIVLRYLCWFRANVSISTGICIGKLVTCSLEELSLYILTLLKIVKWEYILYIKICLLLKDLMLRIRKS